MKYIKLVISVDESYHEPLIAELMDMEFDSFQQEEAELITYIPKERFHVGDRERIEHLLAGFPDQPYIKTEEVVEDQNWNQAWEQTITEQHIGRFLVKPTWSSAAAGGDEILLEIDPKMAFGTGYHETTRLMLRALPSAISPGDTLLDAGTGTGILAIAALKLGASHATGFDIDDWSIINARENVLLNGVDDAHISLYKGSIETVSEEARFDVIVANIQRNPLLDMIPGFADHAKEDSLLLLSGLVEKDESVIRNKLREHGFEYQELYQENEWIALKAQYRTR